MDPAARHQIFQFPLSPIPQCSVATIVLNLHHQRNSVATQAILATDATNKPAMQKKFKEKRDILKRLHCPLNMYDYKSRGHFLLEFGLRALRPCDPRLPWVSI